jgi:hypothetical protein
MAVTSRDRHHPRYLYYRDTCITHNSGGTTHPQMTYTISRYGGLEENLIQP